MVPDRAASSPIVSVSCLRSSFAFGRRCIPAGGVAPPSNTPGILGRHALPAERLAALGATTNFGDTTLAPEQRVRRARFGESPGAKDTAVTPAAGGATRRRIVATM